MVSIAPLAVILLLLVLAVAAALGAIVVRSLRRRRRVSTPSCGSCGYAVAGLEVLRCPECGADLREVGIAVPEPSRRGLPIVWALLAGVAAVLLLLFGFGAFLFLTPVGPAPAPMAVTLRETIIELEAPDRSLDRLALVRRAPPKSDGPADWTIAIGSGGTMLHEYELGARMSSAGSEEARLQAIGEWIEQADPSTDAEQARRIADGLRTVMIRFDRTGAADLTGSGLRLKGIADAPVAAVAPRAAASTIAGRIRIGLGVLAVLVVIAAIAVWRRGRLVARR